MKSHLLWAIVVAAMAIALALSGCAVTKPIAVALPLGSSLIY
jgi:hypothetical protein